MLIESKNPAINLKEVVHVKMTVEELFLIHKIIGKSSPSEAKRYLITDHHEVAKVNHFVKQNVGNIVDDNMKKVFDTTGDFLKSKGWITDER